MRSSPLVQHGIRDTHYDLSVALDRRLAGNTVGRIRQRLKALGGDSFAAARADPIGSLVEPLESRIDLRRQLLGVIAQRDITLARKDFGRVVGHMVADAVIILLVLILDLYRRDLVVQPCALAAEARADSRQHIVSLHLPTPFHGT